MSGRTLQLDRRRARCPFCHEEVAGGPAWLCHACGAAHHAPCHDEQGGCAACALAPGAATSGKAPALEPAAPEGPLDPAAAPLPPALAERAAELVRLGFRVASVAADEVIAVHPGWRAGVRYPALVLVRRVDELGAEELLRDRLRVLEAFDDHLPASWTAMARLAVTCYLAGAVTPEARAWIEAGRVAGAATVLQGGFFFPCALDGRTGEGLYLRRSRLYGWLAYPGLRFLARRLLYPRLDPASARDGERPLLVAAGALAAFAALTALLLLALRGG